MTTRCYSAALFTALFTALSTPAATFVWTNAAGGNWSGAMNWNPNQVPAASDTAVITNDGAYTVTLDVSATVAGLVVGAPGGVNTQTFLINGQTFMLNGLATVNPQGRFNFNSGNLAGAAVLAGTLNWTGGNLIQGSSLTIATGGVLNLGVTSSLYFYGALTNAGTVNWSGAGALYIYNNGASYNGGINNLAGAVFNAQSDQTIGVAGWGGEYFNNAGWFHKGPSAGVTVINAAFNNTGTLDVQSGSVNLNGGGAGNGTFNAAAGAGIGFNGTSSGGTLAGPGIYTLAGGTLTLNGFVQNLVASGGVVNGVNASISNLTWNGGTLLGKSTVTASAVWASGSIGEGGCVTIATNAVLTINESSSLYLYGALTNAGTVNWSGTGTLYIYNNFSSYNGGINNLAGAVFNAQSDQGISVAGWGGEYFNNAGWFRKGSTTGTTSIGVTFNNSGTVDAQTGSVNFTGGGAGNGTFNAAAGAGIGFNGNNSGGAFTGPGVYTVAGGTVTMNGAVQNLIASGGAINGVNASISNLTWNGGTLQGQDTITGSAVWTSGSIGQGGCMTIATNGVLTINESSSLYLYGALTNAGTVNWLGAGALTIYNNGSGYNGGINNLAAAVFNVQNDQTINIAGFGGEYFNNAGWLRKGPTTGTTTIGVVFNNTGTVDVQSGTLNLATGGGGNGRYLAEAGATLLFSSSFTAGSGAVIQGAGTNLLTSGTITINGSMTTSNLVLAGATLAGNSCVQGIMTWSGGTLGGGSSLTIATNGVLNLVNNGAAYIEGSLTNAGTVNWTGAGSLALYNDGSTYNGSINNLAGAVFNAENDQPIALYSGSPYFNNAGLFRKSPTTGTTAIGMPFNNNGTVDAQSGTISLSGGGSGSGRFTAEAGATLAFSSSYTVNSGAVVQGAGTNLLSSGTVTINTSVTASNLVLAGATFAGNSCVQGIMTWSGGTLGGSNSLTIATNGVLNLVNNGAAYIEGSLTNAGTVNWTGAGSLALYNDGSTYNGSINNLAGAVFNAENDQPIALYSGSPYFNNAGLFRKSPTTGTTAIGMPFNNNGTVDAQSGTISLSGGGSGSGRFTAEAGATLAFSSSYTVNSGAVVQGAGTNLLSSGTVTIHTSVTASNLVLAGASLAGNPNIQGIMTWAGGQLNGGSSLTIATNGVLNLVNNGSVYIEGALTNAGTVNWTGAGGLSLYNDGSTYNGSLNNLAEAVFNAENDQTMAIYSGSPYFNNAGLFRKSPTTGTTTIGVTFNNNGTVDVASGVVSLTGGSALSTGSLNFGISGPVNYGHLNVSGSATLGGPLTVSLNNGYFPAISNAFTLVTCGSRSGTFSSANLPVNGLFWQVLYTNTAVNLVVANNLAQLVSIAYLRSLLDPVSFTPTNTTSMFTTEGVVTTRTNLTSSGSSEFYIQDATAGIAVNWAGAAAASSLPPAGSFVQVTAPLGEFNGLFALAPVQTNSQEGVTILGTNNLPAPQPLPFDPYITSNPNLMVRNLEGSYFVASNVFLDLSTPTFAAGAGEPLTNGFSQTHLITFYNPTNNTGGTNFTLSATNQAGQTFTIYYNPYTDIAGKPKAAGPFNIYGVLGQYTTNASSTNGYQFTPTRLADIVPAAPPVIVWTNPAPISYGTALSALQLNAAAILSGTNVPGTFTYSSPTGSVLSVGSNLVTVIFTPTDLQHFNLATGSASVAVTPVPLITVANSTTRPYGTANPVFTGTLNGVVNGDNITAAFTTTAGPGSPVGLYAITPQLADPNGRLANYTIYLTNAVLAITTVPLAVTANNAFRLAGQVNPTFTGILSGVVNGDNITATYSSTATPASPVGTYPIIPTLVDPNGRLGNYNVAATNGTLTVEPTALSITWSAPAAIAYGTALNGLQLSATANIPGAFAYTPVAGAILNAGTNTLTAVFTPADTMDFSNATNTVSLVVLPAPLSVTADNHSRLYGQTNPICGGTLTGVVSGDNITAIYATAAVTTSPIGLYPILPTLVDPNGRLANYAVTTNNGTLTVNGLNPQVTWATPSAIVYGTGLSATQLDANAGAPGSFAYTPAAGTVLPAGTNTLTTVFTPAQTTIYNSATDSVSLTVTPAPLTVTANNASRTYGQNNPFFTGTLTGVVNGDGINALYNCGAVADSPPGSYPIVPALLDPLSRLANYLVRSTNGTLTVTAGPPPTLASITPNRSITNQTTPVTIIGSGFELGAGVAVGGQPGTSIAVISGTQIFAVTPTGSLGATNVVVTNPDGTSATLTNGFAYTGTPTTILTQPAGQSLALGGTAVFSVGAQYAAGWQWQFNGNNLADNGRITGAHGSVLTISSAQYTDQGFYDVLVSNAWGSALSTPVSLLIISPPSIGTSPQSQSVGIGGTATFSAGVGGTAPFTYQWLQGGAPLSGQTNAVLKLANVTTGQQGLQYSVKVTNPAGSATSAAATLTVLNYCASATPSQSIYPCGTPVPLTLRTFNCSSQAPMANSAATVWICDGPYTRSLPATTGPSGSVVVNFIPPPREVGTYQVSATLPGQSIPAAQGTFSLVGLGVWPDNFSSVLTPGIPVTNNVALVDPTDVPLTGMKATVVGSAPDVQVTFNAPGTLVGNTYFPMTFVLLATGDSAAVDQFYVQITTDQGTTNLISVNASVVPPAPQLTATPATLTGSMVAGGQTLINFYVSNTGGATSGPVQVLLPPTSFLSTVTPLPLPAIAPGQSNQITLALTPAATLALGTYTGSLEVTSSNAAVNVPFAFDCISDLIGSLQLTVQDELSAYGAGNPNVSNAMVKVTDFLTGTNVASAVTDASGMVLFTNLNSDYYTVAVTAPNHGSFSTTLLVAAQVTNEVTAFLDLDLVDYTWLVTPTIIPDHYAFTLQTTFQTLVPWPVVTVNPGAIDLCTEAGVTNEVNLTITNSGLISAQGLNLYFGTHPDWSIQPLLTSLGDLPPQSSMIVPVLIISISSATPVPNSIAAQLSYHVYTPTQTNNTVVPIYVYNADPASCNPTNSTPPPVTTTCPSCGGGGGTGGTGGSTGGTTGGTSIQPPNYTFQTIEGALVQVKLQIDQSAVIARDAFKATLELVNHAAGAISNISATITVYDAANNTANNLFGIPAPALTGLSAVDGTGALSVGGTGTVGWTIVPATNAAPVTPTPFTVGGSFSYVLNGQPVTVPLFPVPITVQPTPILNVDYFLQHDVYSDDPFTPRIEPSIPFSLGIRVHNIGYGNAYDFSITSAQPKIIQNSNDLLIAFALIGSQVGLHTMPSPSFTLDLGDIKPGGSADGLWYMTSTLEGQFIAFSATYQHVDDFGNTNTSLINSVSLHEMNHVVELTAPVADDGLPDFLVNDTTNVDAPPGMVYSSDGSTYPVNSFITNGVTVGVPSGASTSITVTVPAAAGWAYYEIVDPGNDNYPIASVTRSDGVTLLVGPNVWQTPERIHMVPPKNNNLIHIFDYNSTGTYTVTYGLPVLAPTVTTLAALSVTPTNATLNALVNPNGADTDVYFQWGATATYGNVTPTTTLTSSLNLAQSVALAIGGLRPNSTNHFRVVGINSAGTTFGSDLTVATPPLSPPIIRPIKREVTAVGQGLVITNSVVVSTPPATFSLDASDPVDATITTNGVFKWNPTCLEGSSTNQITVWVTDSGTPPLSNSMTFTVVVGECVQLELGSTVMQAGTTSGVPVTLLSTVGLTNLNWTLSNPANRLTNWVFASSNTAIASVSSSQTFFSLSTVSGQTLPSPALLGTLYFMALPGPSAFLTQAATNIVGTKLDGSVAGNASSQPERVVVVGAQPLLEPVLGSNFTRWLILYDNPGTNYHLQFTTSLSGTNWQNGGTGMVTNLMEYFSVDPTAPVLFYRVQ